MRRNRHYSLAHYISIYFYFFEIIIWEEKKTINFEQSNLFPKMFVFQNTVIKCRLC